MCCQRETFTLLSNNTRIDFGELFTLSSLFAHKLSLFAHKLSVCIRFQPYAIHMCCQQNLDLFLSESTIIFVTTGRRSKGSFQGPRDVGVGY